MQRRGKGCFTAAAASGRIAVTPAFHFRTVLAQRAVANQRWFRAAITAFSFTGDKNMLRKMCALTLLTTGILSAGNAMAADKLIVSTWGGSFKDLIDQTIAKEFTKETGVEVQFVTGGTIDRLNKAKLAGGSPETDVTFTTAHVGDLWKPELKGTLALPDWDPSHIIAVAAKLSGSDAAHWQQGQAKLKALIPNIKSFYTDDANSQQLISTGETPVQVMLSMNAYSMIAEGVNIKLAIPKEGAILGVDTVGINKGSKHADLAYKFINIALKPEIQQQVAKIYRGSPTVTNAHIDPELAKLPGMLTTPAQWNATINTDPQLRAEKTAEWRQWFSENIMSH